MTLTRGAFIDHVTQLVTEENLKRLKEAYTVELKELTAYRHCRFCNEYGNWAKSIGNRQCHRHSGRLLPTNGGPRWSCCNRLSDATRSDWNSRKAIDNHVNHGCHKADHCYQPVHTHYPGLKKEVTIPLALVIFLRKSVKESEILKNNITNLYLVEGDEKSRVDGTHMVRDGVYCDLNRNMDKEDDDDDVIEGRGMGIDGSVVFSTKIRLMGEYKTYESVSLIKSEVTFSLTTPKLTQMIEIK